MTRKILLLALLALSAPAFAGTAFLLYEVETGGFTKQCVYDHVGDIYVITIDVLKFCPFTIEV
jgi:hypothetical protein